MIAQAILPPIHSKESFPPDIKTKKYPEITGGKAKGSEVNISIKKLIFLKLIEINIRIRLKEKHIKVATVEIFMVVINISI